ncbi:MAG TPA: tRNA (adenosine(37)-N6)-threonylcarbamoyltransferase complex ATPase subunit type 1 TsaE [Hyphomicrobiaceae bacterium]|nr:tRNA (adenosine(37)-N6)-threonylcarbamoyltransferase complex ATPase subunit type 1 TsaE [Hyphomicrobiaceae bacterium]
MQWTRELDEQGSVRLAELIALKIRPGDVIALHGDLGAGKTTLARALIGALLRDADPEVPSPTFALQQTYVTPRLTVAHFDLYRLGSAEEALELGLEEAMDQGAVVVEWPERAAALLPADRIEVVLAETPHPDRRLVTVRGLGAPAARVQRIGEIMAFVDAQPAWSGARIAYLQGDASTRGYARLSLDGQTALLMDAPRQPDGPPIRDGRSYSQIACLAEDMVRPFVAIAAVLRAAGLSAPEVLAAHLDAGLLLVEDLDDRLFGRQVAAGASQRELWRAAVDVLVRLRGVPVPARLPLPDGTGFALPRRDRAAFEIEIELLLDWLWPELKGAPAPETVRAEFRAAWAPVLDRLLALPGGWFLRDYHSPNLVWMPEREGVARVGILDFQDALNEHFAFDLVSLLQDARVDVPEALERELIDYYGAEVAAREPGFDRTEFAAAYAAFGAQRNTRLLGLWVRLLRRDGKPHYLQHYPRTWGYLERNLRHVTLAPLKAWYEEYFPEPERRVGRMSEA